MHVFSDLAIGLAILNSEVRICTSIADLHYKYSSTPILVSSDIVATANLFSLPRPPFLLYWGGKKGKNSPAGQTVRLLQIIHIAT